MDLHEEMRPDCKRRELRRDVDLGAIVHRKDGTHHNVALSNISYWGCQMADGPDFEIGERFALVLPDRGESSARICWIDSERAGVSFDAGPADAGPPIFARPFFFGSGRVFGRKGVEGAD